MQDPNILLTMLSRMAQKPDVRFDKLFQKLYNPQLWLMAYESIAPNPGNMTPGVNGETADGMGMDLINAMIDDLKASRYKPTPVRREYIPKASGGMRPIGIPSFEDKLLQTAVRFILEAIYEPVFSEHSHGFRPRRSCHTALAEIKRIRGIRWWVEGDIRGFFDNLNHETLLSILGKRISDKRFLHLIDQFLKAGYCEDWQYKKTYSGTPQGGNLSPVISNVYLHELDTAMEAKIAAFNKGKARAERAEYVQLCKRKYKVKLKARRTGNWQEYKAIRQQMLETQPGESQDPHFRRMFYVRYADDFLVGIIGSKADATATKQWLQEYLETELQLELSAQKTLITHASKRVRFLGYDIKRWNGKRRLRFRSTDGYTVTQRTCTYGLALLIPQEKCESFAREYGNPQGWQARHRSHLIRLSELEILNIYNAEIRILSNLVWKWPPPVVI